VFVTSRSIAGAEKVAEGTFGKEVMVKLVSPLKSESSTALELNVFVIRLIAPVTEIPFISNRHVHIGFST
jgi:hypothetical protein